MTAADAELRAEQGHEPKGARAPRDPTMRAYCAMLSRFTSSVQSTELALRHEESSTHNDQEDLERASASRLRGISKALVEADAGIEHVDTVRTDHGVSASQADTEPGRARTRQIAGADLGITLTSLARRRDELRAAEADFDEWLRAKDETSLRSVAVATGAVGLVAVVIMIFAGLAVSAGWSLALLMSCTIAVTTTAVAVGIAVQLPQVCVGPSLTRQPDAPSLVRFAGALAGATVLALFVVNIVPGLV